MLSAIWVRESECYEVDALLASDNNARDLLNSLLTSSPPLLAQQNCNGSTKLKILFVGTVLIGDRVIYSLPKHVSDLELARTSTRKTILTATMEAIRRASFVRLGLGEGSSSASEAAIFEPRWLDTARSIIWDFVKSGKYLSRYHKLRLDSVGDVSWEETLSSTLPVLQNRRPIYPLTYIDDETADANSTLAAIHSAVVDDIDRKLKLVDPVGVLGIPRVTVRPYKSLSELGTVEQLISEIHKERFVQFEDRKLRLLDLLENYISERYEQRSEKSIHAIGTTTFHVVWEVICSYYFGDRLHFENKHVASPIWSYDNDDGSSYISTSAVGTLVPDIVHIADDELYIIDAKYYLPEFGSMFIKNQPGATDIAKQYMYVPAVEDLWQGKRVRGNAFAFPSRTLRTDILRTRGNVRMPFLDATRHPPIALLELNPIELTNMFVNGVIPPKSQLRRLFTALGNDFSL